MKYKVIIVKNDTKEMEKLINTGWRVIHAFPHPQGGIFILQADSK